MSEPASEPANTSEPASEPTNTSEPASEPTDTSEPASEPTVLHGLGDVRASVGTALGPTAWVEVTEERLEAWAAACPGAGTGWLALSLTNLFMPEMVEVRAVSAGLNVGTGDVRFGPELTAGDRVRATASIVAADEVKPGAVQTVIRIVVEVDGVEAPAVTVDAISRWLE